MFDSRHRWSLTLLLFMLVACPEGSNPKPSDPNPNAAKVESLSIQSDRIEVAVLEGAQLSVIAKDAAGHLLSPVEVNWVSSAPKVLEVNAGLSATGLGLGQSIGEASIQANINGKTSAWIKIKVLPAGSNDADVVGRWSNLLDWPLTVAHATLMPDGSILTFPWRHSSPWGTPRGYSKTLGYNGQPRTQVDRWDASTDTHRTSWEMQKDVFGAGHDLLEDGRLFVSGGSDTGPDWLGIKQNHVFDSKTQTWSAVSEMSVPRWYPTVTTLPSSEELVVAGTMDQLNVNTDLAEIWNPRTDTWRSLSTAKLEVPLYSRMHVAPDGRVFMSGPAQMQWLDTKGTGEWSAPMGRDGFNRVYGSAVLFDEGKVLELGGSKSGVNATETAKVIDISTGSVTPTDPMHFGRRNVNATALPDGTVLVTGGNKTGNGCEDIKPATDCYRAAEVWNPNTGHWSLLSSETSGRPYHSVALLLPDARVWTAGGYAFDPSETQYKNAQVFAPPYLFKKDGSGQLAARPVISSAPERLGYDQGFALGTSANDIAKVSLIRYGSVTHAFNFGQRFVKLEHSPQTGGLLVRSPRNPNLAPPGYYLLFVINSEGVPSVAKTVVLSSNP